MIALFWSKETWQAGIYAAIYAAITHGLTFDACESNGTYTITYTGGY
jgi:hypothetical protein